MIHANMQKENSVNLQHQTGAFTATDGLELFKQTWQPTKKPQAGIILVHGFGEHSSRYSHLAEKLTHNNYVLFTFDLRGHGKSEGSRFYVRSFDDYLQDLNLFLHHVREQMNGLPIFLFGHSMGGTIVTLYAIKYKPDLSGILLSGAALKIGEDIPKVLISMSSFLAKILPKLPTVKLDTKMLSHDPDVVMQYDNDPLINHKGTLARTGAELVRAIKYIQEHMEEINLPVLIMHGTGDVIVDPEGSRQLFKRAKSKDKSLKLYDGFYHEIMNEPDREQVLADILDWIGRHI